MTPKAGAPRLLVRAKARGRTPSRAAAIGSCADSRVQPLSAPTQEMAITTASSLPAVGPHNAAAASAMGAPELASTSAGSRPSTVVQANTVAMPAIAVPATVARATVRGASSTDSAGTVAASRPIIAHRVSATVAAATLPRDSPLGLKGT
ncbi:hypothetical protein D3C81_648650 [compost metagenome]